MDFAGELEVVEQFLAAGRFRSAVIGGVAMKVQAMKDAPEDAIDLQRDVPTTIEDVEVLRRLHRETPSWFSLSAAELEALLPEGALDTRPAMSAGTRQFTLP